MASLRDNYRQKSCYVVCLVLFCLSALSSVGAYSPYRRSINAGEPIDNGTRAEVVPISIWNKIVSESKEGKCLFPPTAGHDPICQFSDLAAEPNHRLRRYDHELCSILRNLSKAVCGVGFNLLSKPDNQHWTPDDKDVLCNKLNKTLDGTVPLRPGIEVEAKELQDFTKNHEVCLIYCSDLGDNRTDTCFLVYRAIQLMSLPEKKANSKSQWPASNEGNSNDAKERVGSNLSEETGEQKKTEVKSSTGLNANTVKQGITLEAKSSTTTSDKKSVNTAASTSGRSTVKSAVSERPKDQAGQAAETVSKKPDDSIATSKDTRLPQTRPNQVVSPSMQDNVGKTEGGGKFSKPSEGEKNEADKTEPPTLSTSDDTPLVVENPAKELPKTDASDSAGGLPQQKATEQRPAQKGANLVITASTTEEKLKPKSGSGTSVGEEARPKLKDAGKATSPKTVLGQGQNSVTVENHSQTLSSQLIAPQDSNGPAAVKTVAPKANSPVAPETYDSSGKEGPEDTDGKLGEIDSGNVPVMDGETPPLSENDSQTDDDIDFADNVNAKPVDNAVGELPAPQFPEYTDSHFFTYFLTVVVLCIIVYLVFHNKQKIIALIIEGRHERRRRPSTANYKKLDSNLEEVMQGGTKGVTTAHVIY